jgi:hypothetical protein
MDHQWKHRTQQEPRRDRACGRLHGGIVPDYDAAAIWWQVQDLEFYAFQAAAIMIRIAAERTGRPGASICGELAASHGMKL